MSGLAIVTGAAGGLGARIAERLGADGYSLLLVDLDPAVADTAAELSGASEVSACVADLTDPQGIETVLAELDGTGKPLTALVNSAGITRDARAGKMSEGDFAAVIAINLLAPMQLCLALEDRFADGAAVVNMSSRAALGNFGQANYTTSKSGLVGMSRALALRWAPRVRVNALAPSLVDTPMTQAMPPEVLEKLVARIPAGRIGSAEEIAGLVAFLCSDDAAYVTGQVLVACGGRSIAG